MREGGREEREWLLSQMINGVVLYSAAELSHDHNIIVMITMYICVYIYICLIIRPHSALYGLPIAPLQTNMEPQ